jgi:hypothetical protein
MPETPKKRRSIGKIIGIIFAILLLLLVVGYFVGTSAMFLKGVILPKVSASIGADVTVDDASISPFKSVRLQKLKVQTKGQEPVLEAQEVIARYSLMDIIGGRINVDEATLVAPVIKVIKNADGTSNIDAFTKKSEGGSNAPSQPSTKSGQEKPPQINIKNVAIKDGTIIQSTTEKSGAHQVIQLSSVNLKIDRLQNGAAGNLSLGSGIRMEATTTNQQTSALQATLGGAIDFALEQNLMPKNAKGKINLDVANASGTYSDVAQLNGVVDCDISPTEIKDLALRFSKQGNALGSIRISGPFDAAKKEGKLHMEVAGIDRQVLNLVGGPKGMDFGKTTINSQTDVEMAKAGQAITVVGQLLANSFSVTKTNQTTPALDLQANYSVSVDLPAQAAVVKTFTFTGTQNKQALLNAKLSKPMTLDWGKGADAVDESAFAMEVSGLNLADWKAFAGEAANAGRLNLKLDVLSNKAGKELDSSLDLRLQDYAGQFGSNKVEHANINVSSKSHLSGFDQLTISDLRVDLAQAGQDALTLAAAGNWSLTNKVGDIQATITAALQQLGRLAGQPDLAQSGQLNGKLKLTSKDKGETMIPDLTARISDFSGKVGSNRIDRAGVDLALRATVQNNDKIDISELRVNVTQADQSAANVTASGRYGLKSQEADLKAAVEASLPKLAQLLNNPQLTITSGTFKFDGTVKQAATAQTIAGDLTIDRFTGRFSEYRFNEFITALQTDIEKLGDVVNIRKLNGSLKEGAAPGGTFGVSGTIDTKKMAGQVALSLKDINEHTLRTFLQPSLGEKKLISVLINGNATANLQSLDNLSAKADFVVTNLIVQDPKKNQPDAPLAIQLTADAGKQTNVLDLRQVLLTLTPTARAKNQLQIKGLVDQSDTNGMKGSVSITSDSIDVTEYYNLYAGNSAPEKKGAAPAGTASKPTPTTTSAPAKDENKEPEAMKLPIKDFALNLNIGQFYLREIAITNLQTVGKIAGNKINLNPLQMAINGAPVKGSVDADVGVPGYVYNVNLSADRIPLEPLANSFLPERKGQLKGDLLANIQVKGAGVTGVNLKKNLSGLVAFSYTNAEIRVAKNGWLGGAMTVLFVGLGMPNLLDTPLNYVDVHVDLGGGNINLKRGEVASPLFHADTGGVIPIADIVTNSPINKFPVNLYLTRSVAAKAGMLPPNTPENTTFVQLPNLVKLKGTIGKPEIEINKLSMVGVAGQAIGGRVGGSAGQAIQTGGNILQGIFGGQKSAPVTNAPPATTTPKTNAPTTAPNPLNGIINGIFGPKK